MRVLVLMAVVAMMLNIFPDTWDEIRRALRDPLGAWGQGEGECLIKGNISMSTGERIYHVPGGDYYERTRIDASKGERWFCTEPAARAAGWRRSRL